MALAIREPIQKMGLTEYIERQQNGRELSDEFTDKLIVEIDNYSKPQHKENKSDELESLVAEFGDLEQKLNSRKFQNYTDKFRKDYCRRAHYLLKSKIDSIRENDSAWVHNSKTYEHLDGVLEELKELFDYPAPSYDREFYNEVLNKYGNQENKIKRIETAFYTGDKKQKQLTLNSLGRIIDDTKKTVNKIIEKNPEVVKHYGLEGRNHTYTTHNGNEVSYANHKPIYALKCVKNSLSSLKYSQNKLERDYKNTTGIKGLWSRFKEGTKDFFRKYW